MQGKQQSITQDRHKRKQEEITRKSGGNKHGTIHYKFQIIEEVTLKKQES